MAKYSQLWNSEFQKNTIFIDRNSLMTALEVGTFEGLTANYIVETILAHNGTLICVDPLSDDYELDCDNDLFKGQYDRFIENIEHNKERIKLIRESSITFLPMLRDNYFDFIYVDGHHTFNGVTSDGGNAFRLCKDFGYILFDDYKWGNGDMQLGIDSVLRKNKNHKLLLKLNQVLIQKLPEGSETEDGQHEYQLKSIEKLFNDDTIYAAYANLDSRSDRNEKMINELTRIGFIGKL